MFVSFLILIFYLAMQNLHNTLRIRKITSALKSLSKAIGASAHLPDDQMAAINAEWDKACTKMNEAAAVHAMALIAIFMLLFAIWRQGHF